MRPVSFLMSPAKTLPTPTSPPTRHLISSPRYLISGQTFSYRRPSNQIFPNRLHSSQILGLSEEYSVTLLESALARNPTSHLASPIESIRFFWLSPIFARLASVSPASTTLTESAPRKPSRMNTSAKHHHAGSRASRLTGFYSITCRIYNRIDFCGSQCLVAFITARYKIPRAFAPAGPYSWSSAAACGSRSSCPLFLACSPGCTGCAILRRWRCKYRRWSLFSTPQKNARPSPATSAAQSSCRPGAPLPCVVDTRRRRGHLPFHHHPFLRAVRRIHRHRDPRSHPCRQNKSNTPWCPRAAPFRSLPPNFPCSRGPHRRRVRPVLCVPGASWSLRPTPGKLRRTAAFRRRDTRRGLLCHRPASRPHRRFPSRRCSRSAKIVARPIAPEPLPIFAAKASRPAAVPLRGRNESKTPCRGLRARRDPQTCGWPRAPDPERGAGSSWCPPAAPASAANSLPAKSI